MATFYKYAERSAESQVNWAEIGKNMTDMLRQEVQVRDQKKAALDEATRQAAQQISNAPQGEHVGAKTEAIRLADQATKYLLMQNRLMKQGILDPKDYMISYQNLSDGIKTAYSSMKAFQSQYAELMERAKTDKSSALEIQNLEEIQGYGNFRESGFFIDAPTGNLNVGLKEEQIIDGEKVIGLKKGSTRGMQYIDGAIYGRIDKFKPLEALTPIAETLGLEIQSTLDPSTITKLGSITSVEDLRNRKDIDPVTGQILFDFYSSIKDSVNAVMANPLQKASLLADTLGYRSTTDPEAAAKDPKLILKVIDPNSGRGEYQFSAEQDKVAENWMTQQLLSMVTRKEDIKTTPQTSQLREPSEAARTGKENESVISNIAKFYSGDDVAVKEAADFVRSLNPNIDTVDRTGDNIEITFKDGRAPEIIQWKAEDGSLIPIESWITANTNFFLPEGKRIADVNKIVARAGIDKNRTFNPESKAFSAGTTQEKEDVPTAFKRISQEKSGLKVSTFVADNEEETVKNLRSVIASLKGLEGFTLSEAVPGRDFVELKDKNGNIVLEFDLNELDSEIAQGYVNQLLETASNRTKIEDQAIYVGKGRKQSEPQQRTPKRGEGINSAAAQGGFNATQFKQQQTGG